MSEPAILKLIDKPKTYPQNLLRTSSTTILTHSFKLVFVSPELSSVRDYVITHSVRSM